MWRKLALDSEGELMNVWHARGRRKMTAMARRFASLRSTSGAALRRGMGSSCWPAYSPRHSHVRRLDGEAVVVAARNRAGVENPVSSRARSCVQRQAAPTGRVVVVPASSARGFRSRWRTIPPLHQPWKSGLVDDRIGFSTSAKKSRLVRLYRSVGERLRSQRRPRFNVSFRVSLISSCTQGAV